MTKDELEQSICARTRRFVDDDVLDAVLDLLSASRRAALEEAVRAVLSASLNAIWADGRLMDPREVGSACADAIRSLAEGDKQ